MAESRERHLPGELVASRPEELLPAELVKEPQELLRRRSHRDAALVEERERIACGPALRGLVLAALLQQGRVLLVDACLRLRERDPHERIEDVVPVARPGLDLAGARYVQLVDAAFALARIA